MFITNGNGQVVGFQPPNEESITAAKLPFIHENPNKSGEEQPFIIHCITGGDVTFEAWGGQTHTRTMIAGENYMTLARQVTAIPNDTSFSALY